MLAAGVDMKVIQHILCAPRPRLSGSHQTTMDSPAPEDPLPDSTKPQVTEPGDLGFESGPPGIRTLNPPGKSRLLCAIELTA